MNNNRILRERARQDLGGRLFCRIWMSAVGVFAIYTLLMDLIQLPDLVTRIKEMISPHRGNRITGSSIWGDLLSLLTTGLVVLLAGPLEYSLDRACLRRAMGLSQRFAPADLFFAFRTRHDAVIGLYMLRLLYVGLWLLLILPGFLALIFSPSMGTTILFWILTVISLVLRALKSLDYSLAMYIRVENPRCSVPDCLRRSKQMMRGHRWQRMLLALSLLLRRLLGLLCLGVGVFWAEAYAWQAAARFYMSLREDPSPNIGTVDAYARVYESPDENRFLP